MVKEEQVSPVSQLLEIAEGYLHSAALFAALDVGVFDALGEGALTAAEIAARRNLVEGAVTRVLRLLCSRGLLSLDEAGRFSLTPLSQPLTASRGDPALAVVRWLGHEVCVQPYNRLAQVMRTGEPSFEKLYGKAWHAWLSENPSVDQTYEAAMRTVTLWGAASLRGLHDFSQYQSIVDLGGGTGVLLRELMKDCRGTGTLFERPSVIRLAEAEQSAEDRGRIRLVAGDLFAEHPAGADCYVMKHVLHGFSAAESLAILKRTRAAVAGHSRLVIIEHGQQDGAYAGATRDVLMLAQTRGQERSLEQYDELLTAAGFDAIEATMQPGGAEYVIVAAPAASVP